MVATRQEPRPSGVLIGRHRGRNLLRRNAQHAVTTPRNALFAPSQKPLFSGLYL